MNREQIEYYVAENFWDIPNVNYKMMLQKYGRFEHSGDCTNEAHSCLNCQTEDIKKEAEKLHGFILDNFIPKSAVVEFCEELINKQRKER